MAKGKQGGEVLLVVAANVPSMLWTVITSYLRMKKQAKIASREFERALLSNGLPPKIARNLTDEYSSMFSLTTIMKEWGNERR